MCSKKQKVSFLKSRETTEEYLPQRSPRFSKKIAQKANSLVCDAGQRTLGETPRRRLKRFTEPL